MRHHTLGILAVAALVAIPVTAQAGITILYNGETLAASAPPVEQAGRVLVGMRDIFEAMSASIKWNPESPTVMATHGGTVITLTIGSDIAYVNSRAVKLDVAAQIINESTYVPLRFVAEATGAEVKWIGSSRTVEITTGAGEGMPSQGAPAGPVPSPAVTAPKEGAKVGPAVDVSGKALGGSTIRIVTYAYRQDNDELISKVPGIVHTVPVDGNFTYTIAMPSGLRNRPYEMYYKIHVWAVSGGKQSEPAVVRVTRK